MSNQSQGAVLAGQPVAVTAGSGITIDPNTGIISVNAATISGVMKLNSLSAYNAYQWPNNPGTNGQFLQTNGAGLLDWADVQGFAVVTVSNSAPTPADIGELWFDCATGTLNVYQNCVGTPSPNWFNVAQPGFPVLPGNTNASPGFTGGSGIQADPYDCTVTTTGSGSTVQIIQTVTVSNLAPFQFVPIVDLNSFINGGRFSFTNNYADSSGNLTFDILFTDNPPSASGTPYTAAIKVGYGSAYIEAIVNVVAALVVTGGSITGPLYVGQQLTYTPGVPSGGQTPYGSPTIKWFADGVQIGSATATTFTLTAAQLGKQITASTTYTDASSQTATGTSPAVGPVAAAPAALTITSPGSIAPTTATVGTTLNYTAGTFTGGIPTVTPSWKWQRAGVDIAGVAANATSYTTVSADAGQAITVRYQVQDSATPTNTTLFQSTPAVTPTQPFPGTVWAPTPANAMDNTNPGTSSGIWNGPASTVITATGCAEVSVNGTSWFPTVTVNNGQTLYQRWKQTSLCGLNDTGQTIQGSVTDGTYTNFYSLLISRVPSAAPSYTAATGAPGAAVDSNSQNISGMNSTTYITYDASSTGDSATYFAIINGGAPQAIPAAPSTSLAIQSGDTLVLRQTASSTPATARNLVINIGDSDGSPSQQATYTLTAVSTPFPGVTFDNGGSPNAGPETVTNVPGGGTLGTLNGKASTSWSPATTALTGTNIKMQVNGTGGYSTTATAVNGQSLDVAWVTTYLDTITNGNNATGTISGTISGTTYTNTFSFQVKRTASFTTSSGPASGPSGTITLTAQTPNNYNVPVKLYQTAGGTLTSVTVDINTTGAVPLPVGAGSALTLKPGDSVVFSATAPSGVATYTTDIVIGDTTNTWSYGVTVTPTVTTPVISLPVNTSPLNPASNSPAGLTFATAASGSAGGFQTNYSGTQTAADWYVYKANAVNPETSAITVVSTTSTPTSFDAKLSTINSLIVSQGPQESYNAAGALVSGRPIPGSFGAPGTSGWAMVDLGTASLATIGRMTAMFAGGDSALWGTNDPNGSWTFITSGPATSNGRQLTSSSPYRYYAYGYTISGSDGDTSTSGWDLTQYGVVAVPSSTTLTLTDATDLADMVVGDVVEQDNATATSNSGPWFEGFRKGTSWNLGTNQTVSSGTTWSTVVGTSASVVGYLMIDTQLLGASYNLTLTKTGGPNNFWYGTTNDPAVSPSLAGTAASTVTITSGAGNTFAWQRYILIQADSTNDIQFTITGTVTSASPAGKITAIDSVSVPPTLTLSPSLGTWTTTNTAVDISRTVIPPAPTVLPPAVPDVTKYTPVTGFNPLNITSGTFNQAFIPQASLSTSSKYYASVIYTGSPSGGSPVVSTASAWYSLDTASSFVPAPGTAYNGGYFGGQINDGGIVYNLIVADKATGENSSKQWKNSNTAESAGDTAIAQNEAYGFPMSQIGFNGGAVAYPAFHWARSLSISTYNDWYLPAKNELAVLYFFLKPSSATNDNASGSNSNSVAPYTPNTNYGSGFPNVTSSSLFAGGAQAFDLAYYWSATQNSGTTTTAWRQYLQDGSQVSANKTFNNYARAIRREYANAPVAIGAAFGGGFFAGQYQDGGLTYNLIVAPVTSGGLDGQYGGVTINTIAYRNPAAADANPPSQNTVYGGTITTTYADANHPMFDWCVNNATGPNGGSGIGGHTDWYIPAKNELAILCYNLGPNWTTAGAFQNGNPEALSDVGTTYWSATEDSSATSFAWAQSFFDSSESAPNKISNRYARAVRRQLA